LKFMVWGIILQRLKKKGITIEKKRILDQLKGYTVASLSLKAMATKAQYVHGYTVAAAV